MVVKPENVVPTVVATDVAVIQITAVKKDKLIIKCSLTGTIVKIFLV